ncbi:AAA family ATPase [Vibrio parahaemolyticus]|nr:AAA family ATPase [Vibrio parahaemolyticus]
MIETLSFPLSGNRKELTEIKVQKSIILAGANGSGKTRLGTWLEFDGPQSELVRRISAQKSLSMPDSTQTTSMEEAECGLRYGYNRFQDVRQNPLHYKTHQRWNGKPSTSLLNDYQHLMTLLFTEMFQKTIEHSQGKTEKNESIIYKIKDIWEAVLPHRELIIEAGRVKTKLKNAQDGTYSASEMSDGERVVFYLIGQCLTLQDEKILVIDEPELHLHKSIHSKLWELIEIAVPNCIFVYITHDLEFAARKKNADILWVRSFDGQNWLWEPLPENDELPEDLLLEILGSREPVVLVEGTNSSFDLKLYSLYYESSLVIPKGSCANVIQIVKGINESGLLKSENVVGIIDRDRRSDTEINNLYKNDIYVLDVAEVENLFILPEIFEVVCESLEFLYSDKFSDLTEKVFALFESEIEMQVCKKVSSEIMHKLRGFNDKSNTYTKLEINYQSVIDGVDLDRYYQEIESEYKRVLLARDYMGVLKYYNRKSLLTLAGEVLGIKKGEYSNLVIRLAYGSKKEIIKSALSKYLPTLD